MDLQTIRVELQASPYPVIIGSAALLSLGDQIRGLGFKAGTKVLLVAWLEQQDADGITMRAAMQHAGLCIDDIPKIQRDPAQYLGFIEVHIEQGPVLNEVNIPLGVVTSINGSVRYLCEVIGTASHAGTTPMDRRRDAACAVAEMALYMATARWPHRSVHQSLSCCREQADAAPPLTLVNLGLPGARPACN